MQVHPLHPLATPMDVSQGRGEVELTTMQRLEKVPSILRLSSAKTNSISLETTTVSFSILTRTHAGLMSGAVRHLGFDRKEILTISWFPGTHDVACQSTFELLKRFNIFSFPFGLSERYIAPAFTIIYKPIKSPEKISMSVDIFFCRQTQNYQSYALPCFYCDFCEWRRAVHF